MSSYKATAFCNLTLDHLLRGQFSLPAGIWVALFTSQPPASGGGTEVSGGSYARVSAPISTSTWTAASGGILSNAIPLAFPMATASWGTVTSVALMDAASGGNLLYIGSLTTNVAVPPGGQVQFVVGALTVQES